MSCKKIIFWYIKKKTLLKNTLYRNIKYTLKNKYPLIQFHVTNSKTKKEVARN
jgi:hypothetical protein